MRPGGEYFLEPSVPAQRRYEALRAYFVDEVPAAEVADAVRLLDRHACTSWPRSCAPGAAEFFRVLQARAERARARPRRSATGCSALRAEDHSVTEIAAALDAEGTPVSAQTVWAILHAEGLERLAAPRPGGPAPRLDPVKAARSPAGRPRASCPCDHAGLYLLMPAMVELGLRRARLSGALPGHHGRCRRSTRSARTSCSSARGAAASPTPSRSGPTPGSALLLGLTALPKATHLTSYSYRVRRSSNLALLEGLARRCRELGLYTGEAGFNWTSTPSATTARRSPWRSTTCPRAPSAPASVLTFFAQDHASTEMVYANADLTKAEQAARGHRLRRVLAARHRQRTRGCWCFDSQLTTYKILDELCARGITLLDPAPARQERARRASPPCPPRRGRPTPSSAPAATAAPRSTRRSCA